MQSKSQSFWFHFRTEVSSTMSKLRKIECRTKETRFFFMPRWSKFAILIAKLRISERKTKCIWVFLSGRTRNCFRLRWARSSKIISIGMKLPEIARNLNPEIILSAKFRKFSVLAQSRRVRCAFQFLIRVHRGDLRSLTLKTPCSKESLKSNSMFNSVALRENKEPPELSDCKQFFEK